MGKTVVQQFTADAATMYGIMTAPATITEKYEAAGDRNIEILEASAGESGGTIRTRREVRSDVPGFAKKFLSEWNTVEQTETWTVAGDTYKQTYTVDVQGAPVSMSGTCTLANAGAGSSNTVVVEAKCSVPLVGKKIAGLAEDNAEASVKQEGVFLQSKAA